VNVSLSISRIGPPVAQLLIVAWVSGSAAVWFDAALRRRARVRAAGAADRGQQPHLVDLAAPPDEPVRSW
jgi:hypothetical protein